MSLLDIKDEPCYRFTMLFQNRVYTMLSLFLSYVFSEQSGSDNKADTKIPVFESM